MVLLQIHLSIFWIDPNHLQHKSPLLGALFSWTKAKESFHLIDKKSLADYLKHPSQIQQRSASQECFQ